MTIGLIIKQDAFTNLVKYKQLKDFGNFIIDFDTYKIFEIHEKNNFEYRLYGKMIGNNFNKFEFQSCNPYGDIVVIKVSLLGQLMDLDLQEFLNYYQEEEDLDNTILNDELQTRDDEYEINDFCVEDKEENGYMNGITFDDIQSYYDYKNNH